MQRTLISVIVFILVILIFDMMANDSRITLALYGLLRIGARHVDNFARGLAAFLSRR